MTEDEFYGKAAYDADEHVMPWESLTVSQQRYYIRTAFAVRAAVYVAPDPVAELQEVLLCNFSSVRPLGPDGFRDIAQTFYNLGARAPTKDSK